MNSIFSRYERYYSTANSMARNSRCFESCLRLPSAKDLDQKPIGLVVSSFCHCKSTHLTCTIQASMPRFVCPMVFGSANNGVEINVSIDALMDRISSSFRRQNIVVWFFQMLLQRGRESCKISGEMSKSISQFEDLTESRKVFECLQFANNICSM